MPRVLLDEDLDIRLRHHFGEGVHVETVEYRGWKGLENGDLLAAISAAGDVDVLVTADKNMPHQQHPQARPFAVAVLRPRRKRLAEILPLLPEVLRLLPGLQPGQAVEVRPPGPAGSRRRGQRP
jgi:predicted nuclease of predicted toxin-antitoxin system